MLLLLLSQGSVFGHRTLSPTGVLEVPEIVRGRLCALLSCGMVSRSMHVCIYHRLVKLNELPWVCEGLPARDRALLIYESMSPVIAAKLLPIVILLIEDTGYYEVLPSPRGGEKRAIL